VWWRTWHLQYLCRILRNDLQADSSSDGGWNLGGAGVELFSTACFRERSIKGLCNAYQFLPQHIFIAGHFDRTKAKVRPRTGVRDYFF